MSPNIDTTNLESAVKSLFDISGMVFEMNTKGFTHEESLISPRPYGNNVNWIAGHLIDSRNRVLAMLGADPVWPEGYGERYKRGTEPLSDPKQAETWEKLVADFRESQIRLDAAFASIGPDVFARKIESSTVGEYVTFLSFHETYHVGQLGILRRLCGKEGAIR